MCSDPPDARSKASPFSAEAPAGLATRGDGHDLPNIGGSDQHGHLSIRIHTNGDGGTKATPSLPLDHAGRHLVTQHSLSREECPGTPDEQPADHRVSTIRR